MTMSDTPLLATPRHHQDLRFGRGAVGRRLRGPGRRGDGAGRRQRRRQVDADQVRRRHPRLRQWADSLRGQGSDHPRAEGRGPPRDRGRLPGSRPVRQPRRRAEHVSRPRGQPLPDPQRGGDGAHHRSDAQESRGDDDLVDPPAGGDALRRPAPVRRGGEGRPVELQARHPRRADRGPRRGADRAGAGSRSPPRRAGAGSRDHLAQPPRHLRDGRPHHRARALDGRSASTSAGRRRSRPSSRRSPFGKPTRVSGIPSTAPPDAGGEA